MNENLRKPRVFKLDEFRAVDSAETSLRDAKAHRSKTIELEKEDSSLSAFSVPRAPIIGRSFRWGMLFFVALTAFVTLVVGDGLWQLIEGLFQRSLVVGWSGLGLALVVAVAAGVMIVREIVGLFRLQRLVVIHEHAQRTLLENSEQSAYRVLGELRSIYRRRPDVRLGIEELENHLRSIVAPEDLIKLAERDLLLPLDEAAFAVIVRAARRVALLTALTPLATLDVLIVALANLRMLREMATLYGGRPGSLGTIRLARMVIGHLAFTGGVAITDNLLQHLLGRGLVGRFSARFGEGAANGIMTARIGVAAVELCRPLPFLTRSKPTLGMFVRTLLSSDIRKPTPARDGKDDPN